MDCGVWRQWGEGNNLYQLISTHKGASGEPWLNPPLHLMPPQQGLLD